ncbi:DUF6132 family protein [Halosquirtibacter xylanolyticus]|uniref:DUF6132 family protein n=1 Tax=Halosquirtibacter xylanolyticus TaxID=3374599 RepID=UPI003748EB11|nr:DUF6132 family protein [Prolixibacteraceae bacterium]
MIKSLIIKYRATLIGIIIGAVGGYLYWRWIGCESGTCPITSSPIRSSLYGSLMGALMVNSFKKEKK